MPTPIAPPDSPYGRMLAAAERRILEGALERVGGDRVQAAALLGVPTSYVVSRCRRLRLLQTPPPSEKTRDLMRQKHLAREAAKRAARAGGG